MRIKEALKVYNDNRGDKPKITQSVLGQVLMPERTALKSEQLVSRWCKGYEYNQLKVSHIIKMTILLGVDANFLMEEIDLEKHGGEFNINGLIDVIKHTKQTPNAVLRIKPMKNVR